METIKNPIEYTGQQVANATGWLASVARAIRGVAGETAKPATRRITLGDLSEALAEGWEDIGRFRSDVVALCLIYPVIGVVISVLAYDTAHLPLIFPIAAGFALLGPFFAVSVYELSKRREDGRPAGWADALSVLASPSFGAIFLLGLALIALYVAWLVFAQILYDLTLGPGHPVSIADFFDNALGTTAGWVMIIGGTGVGFLFALAALAVAAFAFPILADRDVGLRVAVETSIDVLRQNPGTMLAWGFLVALFLVVGSLPAFVGLIFVMPLLGHATWHLYRRAIAWPGARN